MTDTKQGGDTVAVYAPKAFKFNTGDGKLGTNGIVDIPAGASRIPAQWAAHKWVKAHLGDAPGADANSEQAIVALIEADDLRAKLASVLQDRDNLAAVNKSQAEELEGMRLAMSQGADDRVKAADAKAAQLQAEVDGLRAELAKRGKK